MTYEMNHLETGILALEKLYYDTKKKSDKADNENGKILTRNILKRNTEHYKNCLRILYEACDEEFDE